MKVAEKMKSLIIKLVNSASFPTLEDMMDLEKKAISNPRMLGAIIKEMPVELQNKLFHRSKDPAWLEAYFSDEDLDMEAYHFVLELTRRHREDEEVHWQEFLIALWRLGPELTSFMRTLEQRDALGIFAWMPIEISLPAATEAFPGAWGILLKHDFKPPPLKENEIKGHMEKVLGIKPYSDLTMLERYQHERGLIKYLKTCPLETEKDVYKSVKAGGTLRMLRPPFFEVLEADSETLKEFIPKLSIKDWGIALFNIDRGRRSAITDHLTDREKYVLIETLKECDMSGISEEDVGDVREAAARTFAEEMENLKKSNEKEKVEKVESNQDQDKEQNVA